MHRHDLIGSYAINEARSLTLAYIPTLFVYSHSHRAYLDCGGAIFIQLSRPLSARGGTLQRPPRIRPGLSQEHKIKEEKNLLKGYGRFVCVCVRSRYFSRLDGVLLFAVVGKRRERESDEIFHGEDSGGTILFGFSML